MDASLSSAPEDCTLGNIYLNRKVRVQKSLATERSSSDPGTGLCLIQDIPRCTTFHCCSVILDRVPASSCQNAPTNTHPGPKSSLGGGHSRRLPPHLETHMSRCCTLPLNARGSDLTGRESATGIAPGCASRFLRSTFPAAPDTSSERSVFYACRDILCSCQLFIPP